MNAKLNLTASRREVIARLRAAVALAALIFIVASTKVGSAHLDVVHAVDDPVLPAASLILTVNALGDGADVNVGNGLCDTDAATAGEQCTLRAAIQESNAETTGSDVINFSLPAGSTITLNTALPDITGPLTVNGPGANTLTIMRGTAAGTPNFRIFGINTTGGFTISFSGMTITNGHAPDGIGGNKGENGGGIFNGSSNATLKLDGVAISGNVAGNGGGNGGLGGGISTSGPMTIANSTISGNRAGNGGSDGSGGGGGGLNINTASSVTIVNSTISNNQTGSAGGGPSFGGNGGGLVNASSSSLLLVNCTVSGNQTGSGSLAGGKGGGIFHNAGTTSLRNTIVANNTVAPSGTGPDLSGTIDSQDYNLIKTTTGATINGTTTHNITGVDPNLGPLTNNGGPLLTQALLPGSPALDAANNSFVSTPLFSAPFVDERGTGYQRIVDGPDADTTATVDMGAYETQVSLADIPNTTILEDTPVIVPFDLGDTSTITSLTVTSSNAVLVPNDLANISVTAAGSTGVIAISPAANLVGTSDITVTVNRTGGSASRTFSLTVNPVNDPPSFTKGADQTVNNNAGLQTISNWASNISPGPADESSQTVTFQTPTSAAFTVSPTISSTGTLTYQPAPNSGGTATITVSLRDNGGTANGGINTSPSQTFTINIVPIGGSIGFSASSYNTTESSGSVTITVKRTGDLSLPVTVDYATGSETSMPCSAPNGLAKPKCDYNATLGKLRFAGGEDTKTFPVLINQDSFVEGPETVTLTLSNPTGGSALIGDPVVLLRIDDDVTEPSTNAIDDARNFVRQAYHDFLNREPDPSGWDFWTNQITSCGSDVQCIEVRRIDVSASFFLSIEFQQTGYLVERFYKVAFGSATGTSTFGGQHQLSVPGVQLNEFLRDTQRISQGVIVLQPGWEQALENNKQAYSLEFVQTARFISGFPTSMTPTQFVDLLNQRAGNVLSTSERTTAIDLFGGAANSSNTTARAQALRQVAEDTDLYNAEYNRAFVLAEYFGYLRRNPYESPDSDFTGYDFWLTKLNQFNGNYIDAEMVKAFLSSIEYRQRFGP